MAEFFRCKDCKHDKGKCVGSSRKGWHKYCFEPKVMTNADRIRAMTDEELAVLLNGTCVCDCCVHSGGGCREAFNMSKCIKGTIEWLKQPAQEVAHGQN